MPSLVHLIYASAAAERMTAQDLSELLLRSRASNARLDLTGMLLYCEGSFFQVLEGPADVVNAVFAQIERDVRHTGVTRIISEPIPRRFFREWSMGFSDLSAAGLNETPGANDFFGKAQSLNDVGHGRARKLLAAFAGGRWRSGVHGARTAQVS